MFLSTKYIFAKLIASSRDFDSSLDNFDAKIEFLTSRVEISTWVETCWQFSRVESRSKVHFEKSSRNQKLNSSLELTIKLNAEFFLKMMSFKNYLSLKLIVKVIWIEKKTF